MQAFEGTEDMELIRPMPLRDPSTAEQPPVMVEAGRLPNFLIIGASRSGTTTLHYVLGQHPQIYMSPNKETHFFSYQCNGGEVPRTTRLEDIRSMDTRATKSLEEYYRLFRGVTQEIAVGETSPSYLLTPGVAETIRRFVPEAKIVAVLRQPIEKAYSHFLRKCQVKVYSVTDDFDGVLEQDEARIEREGRGTSFLAHGRYATLLKPYFDVFESDRIHICLFEDMEHRAEEFYKDLFRFLGVDPAFRPDIATKFNQSGQLKSNALLRLTRVGGPLRSQLRQSLPPAIVSQLSRWRHKLQSANIERPPELPAALRRSLTKRYFGDDIRELELLIGRDLSHWLA